MLSNMHTLAEFGWSFVTIKKNVAHEDTVPALARQKMEAAPRPDLWYLYRTEGSGCSHPLGRHSVWAPPWSHHSCYLFKPHTKTQIICRYLRRNIVILSLSLFMFIPVLVARFKENVFLCVSQLLVVTDTHTNMHTHSGTQAYTHTHIHQPTQPCTNTCMHTPHEEIQAYMHSSMPTHIHGHMHAQTCIHTCKRPRLTAHLLI